MNKKVKKKGGLFGVSLGVGHPMNITVYSLRVLNSVSAIFVPISAKDKESLALERIKTMPVNLDDRRVIKLFMPMKKNGIEKHWIEAAEKIIKILDEGKDCAFAGIGDLLLYGTFYYIERIVKEKGYQTMYVPGITSYQVLASKIGHPIIQSNERLLVMPYDNVNVDEVANYETIIFMKKPENADLFKVLSKTHKLFLGKNLGLDGEKIAEIDDVDKDLKKLPYFSLVLARRKNA